MSYAELKHYIDIYTRLPEPDKKIVDNYIFDIKGTPFEKTSNYVKECIGESCFRLSRNQVMNKFLSPLHTSTKDPLSAEALTNLELLKDALIAWKNRDPTRTLTRYVAPAVPSLAPLPSNSASSASFSQYGPSVQGPPRYAGMIHRNPYEYQIALAEERARELANLRPKMAASYEEGLRKRQSQQLFETYGRPYGGGRRTTHTSKNNRKVKKSRKVRKQPSRKAKNQKTASRTYSRRSLK
jgi:hypothetical protein